MVCLRGAVPWWFKSARGFCDDEKSSQFLQILKVRDNVMSRSPHRLPRLADERQPLYNTLVMYHGRQRIGGSGYTKGEDVKGRR